MKYYECHVTVVDGNVYNMTSVGSPDWKYSEISDDIVLGPGMKSYLTRHYPEGALKTARKDLKELVSALRLVGEKVKRAKIELVLIDEVYDV